MIASAIATIKKNRDSILAVFLWLMLWAGYDTDPNFNLINLSKLSAWPHIGLLDLIHAFRGFLPFIAMVFAVIFLAIRKKKLPEHFFLTPLGLLLLYTMVGAISSVFSKNPAESFYSALLYGSLIIVLLAIMLSIDPVKKLSLMMSTNWLISGFLAAGLILFFLVQPGVIPSLTPNLLVCGNRPYEGLAGVAFEANTLGAAGTRPTGLGRYAGVAAIICFFMFCLSKEKAKYIWLAIFLLFLAILIFARGRTEILGFLIAIPIVLLLARSYNYFLLFIIALLVFTAGFTLFYKSVCLVQPVNPVLIAQQQPTPLVEPNPALVPEKPKPSPEVKANPITFFTKSTNPFTLSGRTTGIWPEAWQLFLGSPLVGYGFLADRIFLDWQHAHNTLLQILVQSGIFGSIPFILAYGMTFIWLAAAVRKKHTTEKEKYFFMGMLGVFIFFAVRAITESTGTFYSSDWLLLAPIIAYVSLHYFNAKSHHNIGVF